MEHSKGSTVSIEHIPIGDLFVDSNSPDCTFVTIKFRKAQVSKDAKDVARMLLAAPDLLAACEKSWELLQEVAQINIQPFPISAVALNNQLRAAIAKATGKE